MQNTPPKKAGRTCRKPDVAIVNPPLDFELKGLDAEHPYLTCRGFAPETIGHFGLGVCLRGLLKGRVAVPLHDNAGRLIVMRSCG